VHKSKGPNICMYKCWCTMSLLLVSLITAIQALILDIYIHTYKQTPHLPLMFEQPTEKLRLTKPLEIFPQSKIR